MRVERGFSKDWVMNPEDCPYPPPARMEELPSEVCWRLVNEYYRFDVECEKIRQKHYDNLDKILEPYDLSKK